jgi:hypothetical protein
MRWILKLSEMILNMLYRAFNLRILLPESRAIPHINSFEMDYSKIQSKSSPFHKNSTNDINIRIVLQ